MNQEKQKNKRTWIFARMTIYWFPVIIWMAIIFSFSNRQRISVSETYALNFLFFKTLHVLEYAMLFFLSFRAFSNTKSIPKQKIGVYALLVVIFYAISDEIHQTFVPTREGAPRDVIIDTIGASIAWILIVHISPHLPKKLTRLLGIS